MKKKLLNLTKIDFRIACLLFSFTFINIILSAKAYEYGKGGVIIIAIGLYFCVLFFVFSIIVNFLLYLINNNKILIKRIIFVIFIAFYDYNFSVLNDKGFPPDIPLWHLIPLYFFSLSLIVYYWASIPKILSDLDSF